MSKRGGGESVKNEGPSFIRQSHNADKDDVVSIISMAKSLLIDGKMKASNQVASTCPATNMTTIGGEQQ